VAAILKTRHNPATALKKLFNCIKHLLFLFFYLGYFTRRAKKIAYSLPLILVTLGAFVMDYWYEQLSIVIIFELLLLLDIKETSYPEKEKQ